MASSWKHDLERWLAIASSLLALAVGGWMACSIPWSADAASRGLVLVARWTGFVDLFHLQPLSALVPGLIAADALLAAGLALALSMTAAPHPTARPLRRALAMGALATVFLFQLRLRVEFAAPLRTLLDASAFALYGAAAIDLAIFLAGYPHRPDRATLLRHFGAQQEFRVAGDLRRRFDAVMQRIDRALTRRDVAAYGSDAYAERMTDNNARMMRVLEHPLFRWCCIAGNAACGAWLSLAPGSRTAVTISTFMLLATLLPPAVTLEWLRAKYRCGDGDDRRRIGWIYLGPMLGAFAMGLWFMSGPVLLVFARDASTHAVPLLGIDLRQAWLVGGYCVLPALIASFLLGLAFSMFYRGALDPRLIVHRSLLAGASGLALTVMFVAAENLVSSQVAARFGMPDRTGALVAGTFAALAFAPLRSWIERHAKSWMERLMPHPEETSSSAPAATHQAGGVAS